MTSLQVSKAQFVRIDMMPGYGDDGQRGKIRISSKSYISSINAIKEVSFSVIGIVTLQSILEFLASKGREKYQFTEEGEGCRFWVSVIAGDLESAGIIEAGSGQIVLDAVSMYHRYPKGTEAREVRAGTFH